MLYLASACSLLQLPSHLDNNSHFDSSERQTSV